MPWLNTDPREVSSPIFGIVILRPCVAGVREAGTATVTPFLDILTSFADCPVIVPGAVWNPDWLWTLGP